MSNAIVKEGGLLEQYKLLCAVIDAPWATRLDHMVSRHIIDRYYPKFKNARVSLRYLQKATGATRANIVESLRRVVSNGAVAIVRQGIGTRPTEYDLNFGYAAKIPSGIADNTSTSGIADDTSSGIVQDTSTAPSGIADNTESYLRCLPTGRLTVSRNEDTHAAPAAPPVCGVGDATTAGAARDPKPFEALWAVYPRKHQVSKARTAYAALAPDPELHVTLMASAVVLAEAYRANGTATKWQKHLHTWLAGECWLEAPPEPYESPKTAAAVKARQSEPTPRTQPEGDRMGLSPRTPQGDHAVEIIGSDMPDEQGASEQRLVFHFRIRDGKHEGKEFSHTFKITSSDEELQHKGQAVFAELRNAARLVEVNDTSDLHGAGLRAVVGKMGRIEYKAN